MRNLLNLSLGHLTYALKLSYPNKEHLLRSGYVLLSYRELQIAIMALVHCDWFPNVLPLLQVWQVDVHGCLTHGYRQLPLVNMKSQAPSRDPSRTIFSPIHRDGLLLNAMQMFRRPIMMKLRKLLHPCGQSGKGRMG